MTLFLVSFAAGALTICSPCILPILPFVFSRAGRPFLRSVAPMLLALAITFAAVATLAATGGNAALSANELGRGLALVLLSIFGVSLISSQLAARFAYPIVSLGNRLLNSASANRSEVLGSLLLGAATGMLWAPCAGPIIGLVLTSAALHGPGARTTGCLTAYAAGAATSLGIALGFGGRVAALLRRSTLLAARLRQAVGVAVLVSVVAVLLGWDTGILATFSFGNTARWEERLLSITGTGQLNHGATRITNAMPTSEPRFIPSKPARDGALPVSIEHLPIDTGRPALDGATAWINTSPLDVSQLRGKVILVDFWTYSCINCIRTLPFVRAWAQKYKDQGLVVVGVHTPEFNFEKKTDNVRAAVRTFSLNYPVAVDSDYRIWRAFGNQYWPAMYFIDSGGHIRHHVFGEGDYQHSEAVIQQLLNEASGTSQANNRLLDLRAQGIEAPADTADIGSNETYVGYDRAKGFAPQSGIRRDREAVYAIGTPDLNHWGLAGRWTVHSEYATEHQAGGRIVLRFHARDLHLVLGPGDYGQPIRFRVTIDGGVPSGSQGADVATDGSGVVTTTRLYQMVRQAGTIRDRTFQIEFLDAGARAYVFTFG